MSECSLMRQSRRNAMETIQGQGRDTEQQPLNTGFGPTTMAAEVISGVSLEGKVAIVTGGSSTTINEGRPEYDSTVGAAARFQRDYNGAQPGDPAKAAT